MYSYFIDEPYCPYSSKNIYKKNMVKCSPKLKCVNMNGKRKRKN